MQVTVDNVENIAVDSPRPFAKQHVDQYLESDGQSVDHPAGDSLILLYTQGRRSGKIRRTPLVAFPEGDDLIVMASKAGAPTHPEWYLNLTDYPTVWVRKGEDVYEARATTLGGDDRIDKWAAITARAPVFEEYQNQAGRQIPLVRLTRSG